MTMTDKELMYKVASEQIAKPKLTLTVDGEQQVFEGRDAKVFAFGYLSGCKATEHGVNVDDATVHTMTDTRDYQTVVTLLTCGLEDV